MSSRFLLSSISSRRLTNGLAQTVIRRPAARISQIRIATPPTTASFRAYSTEEETFEEFTSRFEKDFDEAYDKFEVQRLLTNVFSYDLVPAPSVLEKALLAARRVNDFAVAVRVFEGLKAKVETPDQYEAYLGELDHVRKELGVTLQEDLFPSAN